MKKILFFVFIIALALPGRAQQESLHTHIFDNHYWQNPAAAGASKFHKIRLNYRMQFVKIAGLPRTATLTYNGAFRRVGFGARLQYDVISSFERISAEAAYAYHIPLSKKLRLSFGLNLKYMNIRLSSSQNLGLVDDSDIAVQKGRRGANAFDMGAGFYLYTDRLFVGASAINLIQWKISFAEDQSRNNAKLYRQYQAMAGYRFNFNKISFTPSVYFRYVQAAPPQFDVNFKLGFLEDKLFAGLTYRTIVDFALFVGCYIENRMYITYSFDFSASTLQRFAGGSHEITIGLNFEAKKDKPKKEGVEIE